MARVFCARSLFKTNNGLIIQMNRPTIGTGVLLCKHTFRKMPVHQLHSLPRFPVPVLENTLHKYLKSVKVFLNEQEFEKTKCLIEKFKNGIGKDLQTKLAEKAEKTDNWLSDWWLDVAYLKYRDPVVLFSSPGQVFPHQNFKCEEMRLEYAAKLIVAAVDFKIKIDEKKIPPEKMGKDPLDMSQYNKVYGTCRIPGEKKDSLRFNPESKYIIVVSNNNYFKVPVYGTQNDILNVRQIQNQLEKIQNISTEPGKPVGVLTSDNRDTWAKAYSHLISCGDNKLVAETIQNSLFLVCFDKSLSCSNMNKQTLAGFQLIHGGGSKGNVANRWYDKTMQFVISEDGINGMTYEHSPSEGQPIAVLTDYIVDFINKGKTNEIKPASEIQSFECLKFTVDEKLENSIKRSFENVDKLVDNLELNCFTFETFGKNFIKKQGLSPDSFVQMAIQYAFYRIHKVPGAHYESASLRKFIHGRTETIRSCSDESIEFAKAMLDKTKSDNDKANLLRVAIDSHKKYTVDALNGKGVDRHLLGLKLIAIENNIELPDLYNDISFQRSTHMRLSTSQVASRCDGFMVYAPLVSNGYGCCYNPREKDIKFGTSAFNDDKSTSTVKFGQALEDSLLDMHNVLAKTQKSKL